MSNRAGLYKSINVPVAEVEAEEPVTHILPSTPDREFNMDWAITIPQSIFDTSINDFLRMMESQLEVTKRKLYHIARNEYLSRHHQGIVKEV